MKAFFFNFLILLHYTTALMYGQHTPRGIMDYQRNSPQCPISFGVTNTGIIGHDTVRSDPGMEYPRGSGNVYLFNAGIQYSGEYYDSNRRLFGVTTYNEFASTSWVVPHVPFAVSDSAEYARVYFSSDYDNQGRPTKGGKYSYPVWKKGKDIHGIWIDNPADRMPGSLLSSPAMHSYEDIVCKYDDHDSTRYLFEPGVPPQYHHAFGITTEQHIYSFFSGPLHSAIMVRCRLINNSTHSYEVFKVGPTLDPDIGKIPNNDMATFYRKENDLTFMYAWSGPDSSELGYIGVGFLETPFHNRETQRLAKAGDPDAQPMPVWGYRAGRNKGSVDTVNVTSIYLDLIARDSLSDADVRLKLSLGTVTLLPRDTFDFAYAIFIAPSVRKTPNGTFNDLRNLIDLYRKCKLSYKSFMETGIISSVEDEDFIESSNLLLYPAPADSHIYITAKNSIAYTTAEIYTLCGNLCGRQSLDYSSPAIDVSAYPTGIYRIVLASASGERTSFQHPVVH